MECWKLMNMIVECLYETDEQVPNPKLERTRRRAFAQGAGTCISHGPAYVILRLYLAQLAETTFRTV